jgi:hypothetical protein
MDTRGATGKTVFRTIKGPEGSRETRFASRVADSAMVYTELNIQKTQGFVLNCLQEDRALSLLSDDEAVAMTAIGAGKTWHRVS